MNLNNEITALNALLVKYGEKKTLLPFVKNAKDAKRVLKQFVGMGSLSDLYICKMNGYMIEKSEESSVNTNIHAYLDNIRKACAQLSALK